MRLGLRRSCARMRDERGAVTLMMTVVLAVIMVCCAFVVDLGMQRVARSDVQALADVAALDLARELGNRTVAELEPVLDDALADSLDRNEAVIGDDRPDLDYVLGVVDEDGFSPIDSGVPSAVRVIAATTVSHAFASAIGSSHGSAQRAAVAEASSTACFRLGTFVAAVRSGDSTVLEPLNEMLGVNLRLADYRGLADADLRLEQLVAEPTIGSPEALLSAPVVYADLVEAMIAALSKESPGTTSVAVMALQKVAASSLTAGLGEVSLGSVLNVEPTDRAALEVALSVLDIIGSARLSGGKYFLGIPNLQAGVPGVGRHFSGEIHLVSAAELACGAPRSDGASADTAQLDGVLGIDFINLPSLNIPGLGTLQTPKGTGALEIEAGSGTGVLSAATPVHCGAGTPEDPTTFTVDVGTALASYHLDAEVSVEGEVKLTSLLGFNLLGLLRDLLGLNLPNKLSLDVDVRLRIGTTRPDSTSPVQVSIPPNDVTPVSTGGSVHLDPASVIPTVTAVRIAGKSVQVALVEQLTSLITQEFVSSSKSFVEKTLAPLVDNINERFVGPVARMVGLRLGGADVYAVDATCGRPRLVG